MPYTLIDHTADFGIHVTGKDPKDLFQTAAFALFDVITEIDRLDGEFSRELTVTGEDWPDLMVNWLRELLALWNVNQMLVKKTLIHSISANRLSAQILVDTYVPRHHEIKCEIKAVTYHQIKVEERDGKWQARIIFDV